MLTYPAAEKRPSVPRFAGFGGVYIQAFLSSPGEIIFSATG